MRKFKARWWVTPDFLEQRMKDAVTRHEIVQQMERHSKSFWLQEQERQRAQVFGFELPIQVTYVAPLVYVGTDFVESILGKVRAANHGR